MKACLKMLPALFVLSVAAARAGTAPLATNDPRLAQWLKQYPAADVNKDGTLTWDEARAFRAQLEAAGRRQHGT